MRRACIAAFSCLWLSAVSRAATDPTFILSATASSGGKVAPASVTVRAGTGTTFAIVPWKGHHVAEVRLDGATIFEDRKGASVPNDGSAPPPPSDPGLVRSGASKVYKYTFRDVRESHALEAFFEIDTFELCVLRDGLGAGVVTSAPEGLSCDATCRGVFPYNTIVELSAVPEERSVFDRWIAKTGRAKGAALFIRITKAATVTARFARAYRLTVAVIGNGSVVSSSKSVFGAGAGAVMIKENATVKLRAKPARDALFCGWTGPSRISGAACAVLMDQDQFIVAAFGAKIVPPYDLDTADLPDSVILEPPAVIPKGKGAYGHCYLESLAMQLAYVDPAASIDEVFTFAGLGAALSYSRYGKSFLGASAGDWTWTLQRRAMAGYGVRFVLGHSPGISKEYLKGAWAQLTHTTAEEALNRLKAALRTGRPVQVHIDLAYLFPESGFAPGASHFIAITGYDANAVYWTELEPGYIDFPVDPSEYVNIRADLADFMAAWEAAGWINKGSFTCCAPYWMLFFEETQASELAKISVSDALAIQASVSQDNALVIDRYAKSDFSRSPWWKIAMEKRLFGEYLRNNGFAAAADCYELLSEEYRACEGLPLDAQRAKLSGAIRALEVEGRERY